MVKLSGQFTILTAENSQKFGNPSYLTRKLSPSIQISFFMSFGSELSSSSSIFISVSIFGTFRLSISLQNR